MKDKIKSTALGLLIIAGTALFFLWPLLVFHDTDAGGLGGAGYGVHILRANGRVHNW